MLAASAPRGCTTTREREREREVRRRRKKGRYDYIAVSPNHVIDQVYVIGGYVE
jgi:hypothetical protein